MVGLIVAVALSAGWAAVALRLGPRIGLVDVPDGDELKVHTRPAVPLAGPGLVAAVLVALAFEGHLTAWLAVATVGVVAMGIADDRWSWPPLVRLAAEVGLATVAVLPQWASTLGGLGTIVAVAVVVVAINAVNLYDGLDGLAATAALVAAVGLALVSAGPGRWLALGAAVGLIGILPWNLPRAQLFLGDGGSYLVGLVLGLAVVDLGASAGPGGVMAAAVFLGVFVVDFAATLIRRSLAGAPLLLGDRDHLYDRLFARSGSIWVVLAVSSVGQLAYGVVGVVGVGADWSVGIWVAWSGAWLLAGIVIGLLTSGTVRSPAAES